MRFVPDHMPNLHLPNFHYGKSIESSTRTSQDSPLHEKRVHDGLDDSHIPRVTWRSLSMGLLVSMGGLIFGYDTGEPDINHADNHE